MSTLARMMPRTNDGMLRTILWAGSVRVWLASASFEYVGAYGDAALPGEACWLAFYILSIRDMLRTKS